MTLQNHLPGIGIISITSTVAGAETQLKLLRIAADYDWMAMRAAAFELQQADGLARLSLPKS